MASAQHQGSPSAMTPGERRLQIPPQDLNIVWGKDDRYWKVPAQRDEPAELLQVSWLEVTASAEVPDPDKKYAVGFELSLTPDAFGWGNSPVFLMVKRGKAGKYTWRKIFFGLNGEKDLEIAVREGKGKESNNERKIYFGLYEVWSGKWKGGLKIRRAFVRE